MKYLLALSLALLPTLAFAQQPEITYNFDGLTLREAALILNALEVENQFHGSVFEALKLKLATQAKAQEDAAKAKAAAPAPAPEAKPAEKQP